MIKERLIAFGDIHGCYEAAKKAIKIAEDIGGLAIFLGDYIDRGPLSIKTLQLLIEAKQNFPHWIFLRGNHDQMLLDLIEKRSTTNDLGCVLGMNFRYEQTKKTYQEFKALDYFNQAEIRKFLNDTNFYFEVDTFIFLHAVLRNTKDVLSKKSSEELMFNYSYEPEWKGKRFIHGHFLVKEPKFTHNGININTECGYGGVLTGALLDETQSSVYKYFHISENGKLIS